MEDSTWSPIAVGGVGGSGTRVMAEILDAAGVYMGSAQNGSHDNLWFSLLFRRPTMLDHVRTRANQDDIIRALRIFHKAMLGEPLDDADCHYVQQAASELAGAASTARWILPDPMLREAEESLQSVSPRDLSAGLGWGWKEPNTHVFLPFLAEYFAGIKYIHLMRHGLDMAFSDNQNQLFNWGPLWQVSVPRDRAELPRASLEFWIRANRSAVEQGTALLRERFLVVNFDRLCASPEHEIDRIAQFAGFGTSDLEPLVGRVQAPASSGRYSARDCRMFSADQLEAVSAFGFDVPRSLSA